MDFTKDQSAGYLINHLARIFARGLAARLAQHGLALGAFPALLELWGEDGLTQKDLVERLDIEQATMANTLARMERDGLIIRRRDAGDGRKQRIWLTEHGRGLKQAALAAAITENDARLKALSLAERQTFLELMRRVLWTDTEETKAPWP